MTALCPRHPDTVTAPGWMVCARCGDHLLGALRWMADHWDHLGELHTATPPRSGARSVPASRPVINLIVADAVDPNARADIPLAVTIQAWARLVGEQRHLEVPDLIPQQAAWLADQVDWLCAHDAAEEAVDELITVRWQMAGLIGDAPPGRSQVCACGGMIRVHSWLTAGRTDSPPAAQCPACGTTWDAHTIRQWVTEGDADVWVDPEVIQLVARVSRATLDRMARRGTVRRSGGRFELGDVLREVAG